jgi:hypothetical protein
VKFVAAHSLYSPFNFSLAGDVRFYQRKVSRSRIMRRLSQSLSCQAISKERCGTALPFARTSSALPSTPTTDHLLRATVTSYGTLAPLYDALLGDRFFPQVQRTFEWLVRCYGIGFASVADVAWGISVFFCHRHVTVEDPADLYEGKTTWATS